MKFFRQKGYHDCGPIALLNVRRWSGQKVTLKNNYNECIDACKCTDGTQRSDFSRALNKFKNNTYKIETSGQLNLIDLKSHISKGGIAVLLYYPQDTYYSHYCLVVEKIKNGWILVNNGCNKAICNISHKTMKNYMKREYVDGVWFPKLWMINKMNEY